VGSGARLGIENGAKQLRNRLLVMGSRPARASLSVEPDDPVLEPFLAPVADGVADGRVRHAQPPRDDGVHLAICRGKDNLRPTANAVRCRMRTAEPYHFLPLALAQNKRARLRSTKACQDPLLIQKRIIAQSNLYGKLFAGQDTRANFTPPQGTRPTPLMKITKTHPIRRGRTRRTQSPSIEL
jgi:hypothetical protein